MSAITKSVLERAELIEKEAKLSDIKNGIATGTVSAEMYEKMLPAGLTKEHVVMLQDFNTEMIAAGNLALGRMAIPVMKKHKDLERVTMQIPTIGKDHIGLTFDRSRQVPDRSPENKGGTQTRFGSSSAEYVMYGTKTRGELAKVKSVLAEEAMAAFGS